MVSGVFVGEEADLADRVEDQAVVAEAAVVAAGFFEDAHFDAVRLSVGETVPDDVAGQLFHAQDKVVSLGAVAVVGVAEVPNRVGELHHVIHHGDRYIELICVGHVEGVGKQENPVPEAFAVDPDPAALDGHDDPVIAHHEELGDGVSPPDGVGSEHGHHCRCREDQEAGLADKTGHGRQYALSDSLEIIQIDQVEAVDRHSDGVAAHRGDREAKRFGVLFDVQGRELGCQNPDQSRDPRSNDEGGLHGGEQESLHHGAVFLAYQDARQERDGVSHSDGDRIKEGIRLPMNRVGGDRRGRGDEGQHSVHEDAAKGISQAADAGGHAFAQDRRGLLPRQSSELEAEENILLAEVGEQDCQRDIVADACGDAHFQRAAVEKQHCRQVHQNIRDGQKD